MCLATGKDSISTEKGRRQGGVFTPDSRLGPGEKWADRHAVRPPKSTDVPLGDGMVDAARLSILTRREKIRRAVEGE